MRYRLKATHTAELLDLTSLRVIDLFGNQISEIPLTFHRMPALGERVFRHRMYVRVCANRFPSTRLAQHVRAQHVCA
jgi:hypothetical protein